MTAYNVRSSCTVASVPIVCVTYHSNMLQTTGVCLYKYQAIQEDFEDVVKQIASVNATVEITCDAGMHC